MVKIICLKKKAKIVVVVFGFNPKGAVIMFRLFRVDRVSLKNEVESWP